MNQIVMNNFKKEYQILEKPVQKAISRMLKSGWHILGNEVKTFEASFAQYTGAKYCIGVANGLEAIQIALMALGIGKGDEVITVSNSAVATSLAITAVGAKPVFVDIDHYYHMDVNQVEKKITKKTKAILPVHLFGQLVDIKALQKIAKKHGLYLIEDACQAHGAALSKNSKHEIRNTKQSVSSFDIRNSNLRRAGSFGDLAAFSFYPTKNLGGYGDGGAITTNSKELYEKCLMLRNYGQRNRYHHEIKGLNSRLDELQAAILSEKLKMLDRFIARRNQVAQLYLSELKDVKEIALPAIRPGSYHSFHLFAIQAARRDELLAYLHDKGVQTIVHYPVPIHKQKCYSEYNHVKLPRTEVMAKSLLSLPIHPFMEDKEVKKVAREIRAFYRT